MLRSAGSGNTRQMACSVSAIDADHVSGDVRGGRRQDERRGTGEPSRRAAAARDKPVDAGCPGLDLFGEHLDDDDKPDRRVRTLSSVVKVAHPGTGTVLLAGWRRGRV